MSEVWILAEHRDGKIVGATTELVQGAEKLGGEAKFVVLAKDSSALVEQLGGLGVEKAIVVEDDKLENYTPDGYLAPLTSLIKDRKPKAFFLGHTSTGWDLAPRLAIRSESALVTNIHSAELDGDDVVVVRPVYGEKILSKEKVTHLGTCLITVPVGNYSAPEKGEGSVETEKVDVQIGEVRWTVKGVESAAGEGAGINLEDADVIVSGGRGLKEPDNFKSLIEPLAGVLGAAIGASRPVVDDGWLPWEHQVGSSGKQVKPKLYLALGISGQTQHIAGMKNSQCIIAVNKDPEAPIFDYAHYGVVGDLFDIVPKLTEKIKEAKG